MANYLQHKFPGRSQSATDDELPTAQVPGRLTGQGSTSLRATDGELPTAQVPRTTDDNGEHRYVRPMANYLQHKFPGRLTVTIGDSRKTVPHYTGNEFIVMRNLRMFSVMFLG